MEETMADQVIIFDTTLRDGEQSPGISLNTSQKLRVAEALAKLRVDVIEAGFPVTSPGDFEAVSLIAKEIRDCQIAGLARVEAKDIDGAWDAIKGAEDPRIHIFVSTSDIHLEHQLRKSREQVQEMAVAAVKRAVKYTSNVEFSPMDASRSDRDYVAQMVEATIKAGATTVNIPDTVGYGIPSEFGALIKYLFDRVSNIHKAVVSVHCHNDLGMATANSLAAIMNGARQVEVAINGLGERAGNTALEEVVMAIRTRGDFLNVETRIDTTEIYPTSRLVSAITGMSVQANKAVVGANAFAHESGIHQDGVLKEATTYEIMKPQDIGIKESKLVLGKTSGRHAFKDKLAHMGYEVSPDDLDRLFKRFKQVADKKQHVFDEDIEAILMDELFRVPEKYKLVYLNVNSGTSIRPTATVAIEIDGKQVVEANFGTGPIDATYNTLAHMTGTKSKLLHFAVSSITGGTDAQGEVTVRLQEGDTVALGQGSDPDIIVASAQAYLNCLNRLESMKSNHHRLHQE